MKLFELGTFLFFCFVLPAFIYSVFTLDRAADEQGVVTIETVKEIVKEDFADPIYEYEVNE